MDHRATEKGDGTAKRRIAVMPGTLVNQIAAGEVVGRPASVVKELVENALDAGAADIAVEIEKGGVESIRVADDGWGMNREDAVLAFERHATSKIYTAEEMSRIRSFGFRGEALPSIAAVSRVEMITRERGGVSGTRIVIEGGVFKEVQETGCPEGTIVRVADLFRFVPARRKFLKKEATEQAQCLDAVTGLALCHPDVRFSFVAGGRELLSLPGDTGLADRLCLLFGRDFHEKHVPFRGRAGEMEVAGYVSLPGHTRSSARAMYFAVNNRPVRDSLLSGAVFAALRNRIEPRRYPLLFLFLTVPHEEVDVNVHPAKLEVRFRDPRQVYPVVAEALSSALSRLTSPHGGVFPIWERETEKEKNPAPFFPETGRGTARRYSLRPRLQAGLFSVEEGQMKGLGPERPGDEAEEGTPPLSYGSLRYLGQFDGAFLVLLSPRGIVLLDQHAAHERVLFEKMKKRHGKKEEVQGFLIPEVVCLTPGQYGIFENHREDLAELGISAEPYGGSTVLLRSCPGILSPGEVKNVFPELLETLSEVGGAERLDALKEKCFRFLACRGAVKAGSPLAEEEVKALLREMDETPSASTCPHGRPVIVFLGRKELDRMFHR